MLFYSFFTAHNLQMLLRLCDISLIFTNKCIIFWNHNISQTPTTSLGRRWFRSIEDHLFPDRCFRKRTWYPEHPPSYTNQPSYKTYTQLHHNQTPILTGYSNVPEIVCSRRRRFKFTFFSFSCTFKLDLIYCLYNFNSYFSIRIIKYVYSMLHVFRNICFIAFCNFLLQIV